MVAGIGLTAGAAAAGCPVGEPAGAVAPFAGGAGAVDPLGEVEGDEDAGGAALLHEGNASEAASTSR
jgi:hypothetical protein